MKWIEAFPVSVSAELLDVVDGNKLIAEALVRRGLSDPVEVQAFLDPAFYQATSSQEIPNMDKAASILEAAIQQGKLIGVWGDFDVDGQTSTTLLVSGLEALGANVIFHIPVRANESHGINIPNLEKIIQAGAEVLLTCDTGISDHKAVLYAREKGLQVVITDHHDLPPSLPDADAIINSKMLPAEHPLGTLPGVGVAYKLIEELFLRDGRSAELDKFLDLVALGIVADVAYLQGDARYLLQRGLAILRQTQRLGLQTLFKAADLRIEHISETQIGFVIAPRLNALGRLGDANSIVEFLTTEDQSRARIFTSRLEGLNAQRKLLTKQVLEGALAKIEQDPSLLKYSAIVLAHEGWPAGVIGIVASRLVERFHKPVVLLADTKDGNAKGSARSVEGCDISQAIAACRELLEGFGGHPMAAGLAIASENINRFRKQLSDQVSNQLEGKQTEAELIVDTWVPLERLSMTLVDQIEQLAPFGQGNPKLHFASAGLRLHSHSAIGRSGEHLELVVENEEGIQQKIFWWNGGGWELPKGIFDLVYTISISTFNGKPELQVEYSDFRIGGEEMPEKNTQGITIVDHRNEKDPEKVLEKIRAQEDKFIVWAEAEENRKVNGLYRLELVKAEVLVLWSVPPSYSILKQGIEVVQPKKIYVFGIDHGMDNVKTFLKILLGLCKYTIAHKEGRVSLHELAAFTNQTKAAVQLGIKWMELKGHLIVQDEGNDVLRISKQKETFEKVDLPEGVFSDLVSLLNEASAFRKNFVSKNTDQLVEILVTGDVLSS
jgi:single-stranded-DNA-specific exonuclease